MATLTDKPTQRQIVVNDVLLQIENGTLQPGDKLLPTDKLAAHYKVSVPTAHKAVRELVDQGYVTRKTGHGTFVTNRQTQAKPIQTIGLCIANQGHLWQDFAENLLLGLRDVAASPVFVNTDSLHPEEIAELPAFRHLMASQPRVLVTSNKALLALLADRYPNHPSRIIALNTAHTQPPYQITPDYRQIGVLAAEHFIAQGHATVDYIDVNSDPRDPHWQASESSEIEDGLRAALEAGGAAFGRRIPLIGGINSDATRQQIRDYLATPDRPRALLCRYSHRAMEVKREALAMGLSLPQDLSLISTLNTPWTESLDITAVDHRFPIMATICIRLIHQAMEAAKPPASPHVEVVEPRLIVRSSTTG